MRLPPAAGHRGGSLTRWRLCCIFLLVPCLGSRCGQPTDEEPDAGDLSVEPDAPDAAADDAGSDALVDDGSDDCCIYPEYYLQVISPSYDFDGDTIPNETDEDDDDDTVADSVEHIVDLSGTSCCLNNRDWEGWPDGFDSDADGDTVCDWAEVNVYGTDRLDPNTDGDGLSDFNELRLGSDPLAYDIGWPGGEPYGDNWLYERINDFYSSYLETSVVAGRDAALAHLEIRDLLPPMYEVDGTDLVTEMTITGLVPADGGVLTGPTSVAELRSGTAVEVELTAAWPAERPVPDCDALYLLGLSLADDAGTVLSDEVGIVVMAYVYLENPVGPLPTPTHLCGLLPECPVRAW